MKIKNKTLWQTRDLRRIICRAIRENEKIEGKLRVATREWLEIEIVYSNGSYVTGCATYSGSWMKLRVPRVNIDKNEFAHVVEHEIQHIRGYHHRRMARYWRESTDRYKWAEDDERYPMRSQCTKVVKPKPKKDLRLRRYEHVLVMVKKKEGVLKRTQKLLRKWRQKQRYYERVLVSANLYKEIREWEGGEKR